MVDSIHEKMEFARQLAYLKLTQKHDFRLGTIPQSVIDAEAKKYMKLSVQELKKELNNIPNMLCGSTKNKDGWELMGLHYSEAQKKVAKKNIDKLNASVYKHIKNKKVPTESYQELTKEIEESQEQEKVSKMSPTERKNYIAQKIWKAKDNKDVGGMASALFEFYEYDCQDIDKRLGINDFKKMLTKYTGADTLSGYIHKKANDGNPNNLSSWERVVSILDGVGDMADGFVGTEGLTMGTALGGAGKIPAVGRIVEAGFAAQGTEMAYNGGKEVISGRTEEEVRNGSSKASMGFLMFSGGLKIANDAYKKIPELNAGKKVGFEAPKVEVKEVKADKVHVDDKKVNDGTAVHKEAPAPLLTPAPAAAAHNAPKLKYVKPEIKKVEFTTKDDIAASDRINKQELEKKLSARITNKENLDESFVVKNILKKVANKNMHLVNLMLEEGMTNEQILATLNSLSKIVKTITRGTSLSAIIPEQIHFPNNSQKIYYAEKLIANKEVPNEHISSILNNFSDKNSKLLDLMLEDNKFDKSQIASIMDATWGNNAGRGRAVFSSRVKLASKLVEEKDFSREFIADIVNGTYPTNIKLAEKLCSTPNFPKWEISEILNNTMYKNGKYYWDSTIKFKNKFADRLADDNTCPKEAIADIVKAIDKRQMPMFENLYADKNIPKNEIASILNLQNCLRKGTQKLDFLEKVDVLTNSIKIDDSTLSYLKKYGFDEKQVKNLVNNLSLEMGLDKTNIKTSTEKQSSFIKGFLANNNIEAQDIIKKINLDEYKKGLPLKYPRQDFINDVNKLLRNCSEADRTKILQHFGLNFDKNGFEGFPIIPKITGEEFNERTLPVVKAIEEKITNFTLKNETTINDPKAKAVLDELVQGLPEFTTIIGKAQHMTHKYSVDTHTLKVLQQAMQNPKYEELSDKGKTILKFSILLHDIGKKADVVDKEHFETSAKYAIGILDKFNLPASTKSQIIETAYNHHWFEEYNNGKISGEYVNTLYRTPEALNIATIMAKADFASVNSDFHLVNTRTRSVEAFDDYMNAKFIQLNEAENNLHSKSSIVIDTKFKETPNRHFPIQKVQIKGQEKEIHVLNLTDNNTNNNLYEYGFAPNTTKDSARFIVHMNDEIQGLKVFFALSQSPVTNSIQSLSLISKGNSRTFKNQIYGVIADVDQANISAAFNQNISSGYHKNLKNFSKQLYSNWGERTYVRDNLIKNLQENGIKLNTAEYAQLSSKLLDLQYTSQITKDITIGDKVIKADVLKNALESSRDALFKDASIHSEIVTLNPRVKALVAKVHSIKECNPEFLEMAYEYNLPILLIGK